MAHSEFQIRSVVYGEPVLKGKSRNIASLSSRFTVDVNGQGHQKAQGFGDIGLRGALAALGDNADSCEIIMRKSKIKGEASEARVWENKKYWEGDDEGAPFPLVDSRAERREGGVR